MLYSWQRVYLCLDVGIKFAIIHNIQLKEKQDTHNEVARHHTPCLPDERDSHLQAEPSR